MPLYEYQCKKCHHRFERIQKFSDPHVKKCPDCGGPVEQVISAPAVPVQSSGGDVTDYARKSLGTPAEAPSRSSAEGDLSGEEKEKQTKEGTAKKEYTKKTPKK